MTAHRTIATPGTACSSRPGALALATLLLCGSGPSRAVDPPSFREGRYALRHAVTMPHLEEALRDQAGQEERCLAAGDATAFFPLLAHSALAGCRLAPAKRIDGDLGYWLQCANTAAASGTARISAQGERLAGQLDLKMGGKNMTLTQRVEGQRLGDCRP